MKVNLLKTDLKLTDKFYLRAVITVENQKDVFAYIYDRKEHAGYICKINKELETAPIEDDDIFYTILKTLRKEEVILTNTQIVKD